MNKITSVKRIIELMNVDDNLLVDYEEIISIMNDEFIDMTPLELAIANEIDPSIFNVVRLVRLTMEWQDNLTHKIHGY